MFLWIGKGNLGLGHVVCDGLSNKKVVGRESNSHWLAEPGSFCVDRNVFLSIEKGSCWKKGDTGQACGWMIHPICELPLEFLAGFPI